MNFHYYSTLLASGCLIGTASAKNIEKHTDADKPNVVFILVDDFGWSDVGYNGSRFYETPNIDRLASEGVQFTNGYAAAPVSSPTRLSIMTGKYPARLNMTDWLPGYQYGKPPRKLEKYKMLVPKIELNLPHSEQTIGTAMQRGGYSTWFVGKWHCSMDEAYYPQHHGFDVNIGGWLKGSPNGKKRVHNEGGAYYTPYNNPYLPDGPEGEFLTDRLGDEAVKLMKNSNGKPFFLFLSFYAVHTPIEAKPEKTAYFKEKAKRMGIDTVKSFTRDVEWFRQARHPAWHWRERVIQSNTEYAALISSMDENVGKVLDYLKTSGLEENTVVCFLSDNGGVSTADGSPTCNAPLRAGKGWLYEGGIREPYIIKYPRITRAGSLCDTPVTSTDFYPTILELAGLPAMPQQHMDGVSLVPTLKGKKQKRGPIFFHYPHYGGKGDTPAGAIREGDWKLIEFFEDSHIELYNIKNDISEKHDLSASEPRIAKKLLQKLHQWQKSCDARMPVPNKYYQE